jgi:hypothetical protein
MAKLNKKFSELKGATQKKLIAKYGSKAKAMAAHSAARTLEGKKKNPHPSKAEKKAALKIVSDDNKVGKDEAKSLLQMGIKPKTINKFVGSKSGVNYSKKAATTVSSSAKNPTHAQAALSLTKSGNTGTTTLFDLMTKGTTLPPGWNKTEVTTPSPTPAPGQPLGPTTPAPTPEPTPAPTPEPTPAPTPEPTPGDGGKGNGGKDKNLSFGQFEVPKKYDKNYDPFSEIEYPEGKSGKDFKKYKTQRGKILRAAKADLANKRNRDFKPEVIGKAADLREAFLGDPSKKKEKLKGRAKRQYKLDKIGKAKKPKFKDFKERIEKIREGKKIEDSTGTKRSYAYSGKFKELGEKLGIEYGSEDRKKRTKDRFAKLSKGLGIGKLTGTYKTASDTAKTQREKGREAMKLFRGESVA